MNTVFPYIHDWFLQKERHFAAFAETDSRLEGWFKAEMIMLLRQLEVDKLIKGFVREFSMMTPSGERKQIDFRIELTDEIYLLELKAMCISQAAGTPRNLAFYFREDHVGLIRDLRKLDQLTDVERWGLAFIYPAPGPSVWNRTLNALPDDLKHWHCTTRPEDYPDYVFLALMQRMARNGHGAECNSAKPR